jgi:hypothetical protein
MTDSPISPSHYKNGSWEAIEVIEKVHSSVIENGGPDAAYNVAAALKYLLRSGRKGETREQLEKAEWHLRRAINHLSTTI